MVERKKFDRNGITTDTISAERIYYNNIDVTALLDSAALDIAKAAAFGMIKSKSDLKDLTDKTLELASVKLDHIVGRQLEE